MGSILNVQGVKQILPEIPATEHPEGEIRTVIGVLTQRSTLTGEQIWDIIQYIGDDIVVILSLVENVSISSERKRALWLLAAAHKSIICLPVPKDFLPRLELEKREDHRTRAYAYFQAYLLSYQIARSYAEESIPNKHMFYQELPNALIALMNLHNLGVRPFEIWKDSPQETFMDKCIEIARVIMSGIKSMHMQRTQELDKLLHPFTIRKLGN